MNEHIHLSPASKPHAVDVVGISKTYGNKYAVRNISFSVEENEVVGILGPNGAGKSTTLSIITGYRSPSDGKVIIAGYDMDQQPEKARECIGYLPEIAPLYPEMTVREYLHFVCRLKTISRDRSKLIYHVARSAHVDDVLDRPICNLSKGYRQRVGFAQALIGDPKVLVLDEPMVGLDPNQISEMRELIRALAQKCAILLSSHILSEVQTVCDRVVVMRDGTIVADTRITELSQLIPQRNQVILSAMGAHAKIMKVLSEIPDILEIRSVGDQNEEYSTFTIVPKPGKEIRISIFSGLAAANCPILELYADKVSLEEAFHKLTQSEVEMETSND